MTTETPARSRFSGRELLPELGEITAALFKVTGNGSVPPTTIGLIGLRACQITGNTYTLVRAARELRKLGESEDRIDALASWWDAPYYTDAERAALALVEALLRPSPAGGGKSPRRVVRAGGRALRAGGPHNADDRNRPGHVLHAVRANRQAAAGHAAVRDMDVGPAQREQAVAGALAGRPPRGQRPAHMIFIRLDGRRDWCAGRRSWQQRRCVTVPTGDKKRAAYRALQDRILHGEGTAPAELRARAFGNDALPSPLDELIGKVATRPAQVTEADFAAAKAAGYSEDQLFELVVCAAVGWSARLYDAGLAALAEAVGGEEPASAP